MNSKNCFLIGIGVVAILALLLVIFSSSFFKVTSGKLQVDSNIDQVKVIVNDETYATPFEIDQIKAGEYSLWAYKEGYKVQEIPFIIKARKTTEIKIELERDPVNEEIIEGAPIN